MDRTGGVRRGETGPGELKGQQVPGELRTTSNQEDGEDTKCQEN